MPTSVTPASKENSTLPEPTPIPPPPTGQTPVRVTSGATYGVTAQAASVTQVDLQGEFALTELQRREREEGGTGSTPPPNDVPTSSRSRGTVFTTAPYTAALVTATALLAEGTRGLVREGVWNLDPSGSNSNSDTTSSPTTLAKLLGKEEGTPVTSANDKELAEQWTRQGARPKTAAPLKAPPRTPHPLSVEARTTRRQEAQKAHSRHKRSADDASLSSTSAITSTSPSTSPPHIRDYNHGCHNKCRQNYCSLKSYNCWFNSNLISQIIHAFDDNP